MSLSRPLAVTPTASKHDIFNISATRVPSLKHNTFRSSVRSACWNNCQALINLYNVMLTDAQYAAANNNNPRPAFLVKPRLATFAQNAMGVALFNEACRDYEEEHSALILIKAALIETLGSLAENLRHIENNYDNVNIWDFLHLAEQAYGTISLNETTTIKDALKRPLLRGRSLRDQILERKQDLLLLDQHGQNVSESDIFLIWRDIILAAPELAKYFEKFMENNLIQADRTTDRLLDYVVNMVSSVGTSHAFSAAAIADLPNATDGSAAPSAAAAVSASASAAVALTRQQLETENATLKKKLATAVAALPFTNAYCWVHGYDFHTTIGCSKVIAAPAGTYSEAQKHALNHKKVPGSILEGSKRVKIGYQKHNC